MNRSTPLRLAVWIAALSLTAVSAAFSQTQDSITTARELYASASYEEALGMLNRLRTSGGAMGQDGVVEQYRALCLLALGRTSEAQHAIEIVVATSPSFQPSETEASPRVRSAFSEVRRRMLPTLIQQEYGQAKGAFDRKDFIASADGFKRVLDLLNDPDVGPAANQPPLSDLRTLAGGFRDLSLSASAPAPLPAVAVTAPPPPPPPEPRQAPIPKVAKIFGVEDANVAPPTVLRQVLPSYPMRTPMSLTGALAVVVSETGVVESAAMLLSVNPSYDRLVLDSAKNWRYRPATVDGVPVKYRRIVQIKVAPNP
jgi:hypothetical protein